MHFVVPAVLVAVAVIHALPLLGVLGAARLSQLYGIKVEDPSLELLLRHRAVLFGLLAGFLAWSAAHPELHGVALVLGLVSVVSFLVLAQRASALTAGVVKVVRADWVALTLLVLGTAAQLARPA